MGQNELQVTLLTGALGAEIRGVNLAAIDDPSWEAILSMWETRLVLFFPDQDLDPAGHVALGRRLGDLDVHPHLPKHPDLPEIVVLASDQPAEGWHTDATFLDCPPMASILAMRICPSVGGDTGFSNQELALEMLSPAMKSYLEGLTAWHDASSQGHPEVGAFHPVVRRNPMTGRQALFVNRSFTRRVPELRAEESDALLRFLFRWSEQERFQCRYRWSPGTIAIWDNRSTQHNPIYDYDEPRLIHRVTVLGDRPGPLPNNWPHFVATGRARTRADLLPAYSGARAMRKLSR